MAHLWKFRANESILKIYMNLVYDIRTYSEHFYVFLINSH